MEQLGITTGQDSEHDPFHAAGNSQSQSFVLDNCPAFDHGLGAQLTCFSNRLNHHMPGNRPTHQLEWGVRTAAFSSGTRFVRFSACTDLYSMNSCSPIALVVGVSSASAAHNLVRSRQTSQSYKSWRRPMSYSR